MSDTSATDSTEVSGSPPPPEPAMGTFDESGEYTPREVVVDDLGGMSL
jgi:hypothetical protein